MRPTRKAASKAPTRARRGSQPPPTPPELDPGLRAFLEDLADLTADAVLARLKAPGNPSVASPGGSASLEGGAPRATGGRSRTSPTLTSPTPRSRSGRRAGASAARRRRWAFAR